MYPTVDFAVAISANIGFALKPSKMQSVLGRSWAAHHETAITKIAAADCKVPILIPKLYYKPWRRSHRIGVSFMRLWRLWQNSDFAIQAVKLNMERETGIEPATSSLGS